ncbi:MAG: epoxide hydrolase [Acidobacteria bacterium]|nr:epoxide hydrolase [Acidobacteriota bacterium]
MAEGTSVQPFRIAVPDEVLTDLDVRLARTRFPNEIEGIGWDQGTPLAYLDELVEYWRHGYNWRAHEARLNAYEHGTTVVDGQQVHFMHVRSPHASATPLVLCHGWPGSIVEFLETIGPLTDPPDPADAFHLIIPSLPGYGFSGPTTQLGWTPRRIAEALGEVVDRLGYDRYGVQGGDWGSFVVCNMADLRPDRVIGLHVNYLAVPPPKGEAAPENPLRARINATGSGYQQIQGTKPQTIGYLLDDSPAGLAGWIVEKFREWSDCDGDVGRSFTKDQLLTNVMVYWVTRTATSAARLYWETRQAGRDTLPQAPVTVPTGVAVFPKEAGRSLRSHAERRYNIVHWTEPPRGGHFAAMEVPELFVDDVRTFFRGVR